MCDLANVILKHWKGLNTKALVAYAALSSFAIDGQCDAYQDELASLANMTPRHFRRATAELEAAGLITIKRYYDKLTHKTRNTYILPTGQHDVLSVEEQPDNMMSYRPSQNGKQPDNMMSYHPPKNGGQPDNMESAMHDDDDDDDIQISKLLDFIHEGHRKKLMKRRHVNLPYADAWREWWDRREYGALSNPAGWAASEIADGHWPPAQMPLPGEAIDLTPAVSKASKSQKQPTREALVKRTRQPSRDDYECAMWAITNCLYDDFGEIWATSPEPLRKAMPLEKWVDLAPGVRDRATLEACKVFDEKAMEDILAKLSQRAGVAV